MNRYPDRRNRDRSGWVAAWDATYHLLRLIARHARGFFAAVFAYVSFSFIVLVGAIWAFAEVAGEVLAGSTQALDEWVLTYVESHRSEILDHVALEITALGNFATLTVLVLVVSVFLWETRHRISVALLLAAMAGGGILNTLLKDIFDRPRPTVVEASTEVMTQSFPSGHAMAAFIAYAGVAYLAGRLGPTRALRVLTWAFAAILIVAVGASRIYLGVHYPSDVLAGYLGGLAWLAFVMSGIVAARFFARREPSEAARHEQDLEA
jgi:undecaprenyl-diphosphatase